MLEDFELSFTYKVNPVNLGYSFLIYGLISLEGDWYHVVVYPLKSTLAQ
jgi:hypothetical protein